MPYTYYNQPAFEAAFQTRLEVGSKLKVSETRTLYHAVRE